MEFEPFAFEDWYGEVAAGYLDPDLEATVRRLTDPANATETVHWGRNYLYRTLLQHRPGESGVTVKQFRNQGLKKRTERRLRGSKAARSWRMARAFVEAGLPTARPVAWIESTDPEGSSFFVTEHIDGVVEARFVFRAAGGDTLADDFPELDYPSFLEALGQLLRRMHDAGLFHRDLSIGNVLVPAAATSPGPEDLYLIDLNRARRRSPVGLLERQRDLCRLTLFRTGDQSRFLRAYWGGAPGPLRWGLFKLYHHGFRAKLGAKKYVRAPFKALAAKLLPRSVHAHIPRPEKGAGAREKIVWDPLSDQPWQHAGKLEKLWVRLLDAPSHLRNILLLLSRAPGIWRAFRRLRAGLYTRPVPWAGVGVCIRPHPQNPEALLQAIDDLGVGHLLLRLHPWQERHDHEEALAAALHAKGYELTFALPQDRRLVRDPELWRRRVEDLARRFVPYGRHFQVGQAINRSKWGVWRYGEFLRLARIACEVLRAHPGVEVIGPGVIDFEFHATATVVNLPSCPRFDALASLLYVDRRGAPENRQMGYDTVDKALWLQAIAETARACGPRSWITEVNWPLWEGPHSPAGKSVSVDEGTQADYLTRYYLLALTSGAVERVYWWQLVARGYGLATVEGTEDDGALRRRPSFLALATLNRRLAGSTFLRHLPAPAGCRLLLFDKSGESWIVGWSEQGDRAVTLPARPEEIVEQDGEASGGRKSPEAQLAQSIRYFRI